MNGLDVLVFAVLLSSAYGGFRFGLVARLASWLGLVLGLLVASRLLPLMDRAAGVEQEQFRALAAAGFLLAGALAGQAVGLILGARLRAVVLPGRVRLGDRVGGALAGGATVLLLCWLLLPPLGEAGGWSARLVDGSAVGEAVERTLPPPPDALASLQRIVGVDRFPRVFDGGSVSVEGPPPTGVSIDDAVLARARQRVVRVHGSACGRTQEGTGFLVGEDLVLTNAHVVAGQGDSQVHNGEGEGFAARLLAFDPARDLAVLEVPGLGGDAMDRRQARRGEVGVVLGHPGKERTQPYRIDARIRAQGDDLYGESAPSRDVFVIAADLLPGDSGAPLVAGDGKVVGVAFAVSDVEANTAYALTAEEIDRLLGAEVFAAQVGSGPCLDLSR